jgi:hypothetical protein
VVEQGRTTQAAMRDDDPAGRPRPDDAQRTGGLSPVKAFFLLIAVGLAAAVAAFATQPDAAPSEPPGPARSPDFSLTDAEAIEEFERLNEVRIDAYKARDIALLDDVLTARSPLRKAGHDEIRQLLRDEVIIQSRFVTEAVDVVINDATKIVVRQTEVDYPKFVSDDGVRVAGDTKPKRRVIEWVLHLEGFEWKIHDSRLISHRLVR